MMRIGQGYDAHRYANDDRTLVLGGVSFEDERGLEGHSDADVVTHAVIDAMLSAAGLGDIGENFSDNNPLYAGADSVELLKRTAKMVGDKGFILINADCTVIIDKPNISQVKSSMESILSTAAGGLVTVCGKRTEGIGALGRGEGAVALSVALLGVK